MTVPFTASHPAAVAAMARWGLPVPALVIGSMVPDFPGMLSIPAAVHFAHTPWGLVTLDAAVGVTAFAVWRAFLGPAVQAIAPRALSARLRAPVVQRSGNLPGNPRFERSASGGLPGKFPDLGAELVRVVMAVLLGAATHLVWDSFTHDWMWGPQHIPWLAERHGPLLGWQWVGRISDWVGLAIVAAWAAVWWRRAPVRPDTTVMPLRHRVAAWLVILGPSIIVFGVLMLNDSFYVAITRAAGLGVIGLLVVAAAVRRRPGARDLTGG